MFPESSLVAFESSNRTFLSDPLPRSDLLCKLLINDQRSAKAATDAKQRQARGATAYSHSRASYGWPVIATAVASLYNEISPRHRPLLADEGN